MNELKGINWNEWIEMQELKWINYHDLKWTNWNEWNWTEWMKWMNWHERITKLKRMTWNEWLETNELTSSNWFEWMELNEWHDWLDMTELTWKSGKRNMICFYFFVWSTTWWCGWHVKSSSRYSLVHVLSTSSSKSASKRQFFTNFIWNLALATV